MPTSDPYAAKRALFALFTANTGPAQVLDGVQVAYAYPRAVEMRCVYGGGVRFDHEDTVEEGPGILVDETVTVGVYVRVVTRPGQSVEETDVIANGIGVALLGLVRANPTFAGAGTWIGMGRTRTAQPSSGIGDYEQTDDETVSRIGYQFEFGRRISY
jgi:hypothetical protein